MSRPVIGITAGLIQEQSGVFRGHWTSYLNDAYIRSVNESGAVAVVLPVTEDLQALSRQLELLDGIILSGGADVNPLCYGEEPSPKLGELSKRRDDFEYQVLTMAKSLEIPVLGICRGLQLINVYFGGSLYQDLSALGEQVLKHGQQGNPESGSHSLRILEGCFLAEIFGETTLVNSFHHQGIKQLAPSLKAIAWSKDGLVEAVESQVGQKVIGVQWHPEMMSASDLQMAMLFKYFTQKVCGGKKKVEKPLAFSFSPVRNGDKEAVEQFFETVLKDLYKRENFGIDMAKELIEELKAKQTSLAKALSHEGTTLLPQFYKAELSGVLAGVYALAPTGEIIVENGKLYDSNGQSITLEEEWLRIPEIASFFILPALQGKGLGKRMFEEAVKSLREMGYDQFCLDCGYPQSQGFWQKVLGSPENTLKDFWGPHMDHLIWHRKINL